MARLGIFLYPFASGSIDRAYRRREHCAPWQKKMNVKEHSSPPHQLVVRSPWWTIPCSPDFFFQGTPLWQQPAGACSCPFLLEHSSTSAAWMEWLSSRLRTVDQILISVRHPTTSLVLITYSLHPCCIPKRHLTRKELVFLMPPFVEPENHH